MIEIVSLTVRIVFLKLGDAYFSTLPVSIMTSATYLTLKCSAKNMYHMCAFEGSGERDRKDKVN